MGDSLEGCLLQAHKQDGEEIYEEELFDLLQAHKLT